MASQDVQSKVADLTALANEIGAMVGGEVGAAVGGAGGPTPAAKACPGFYCGKYNCTLPFGCSDFGCTSTFHITKEL